ncbi:NAD-dependent epimerase/dehydratase family protein [Mucilaginibacter antarcticus]|uniref:NAD-dependent epimerase/dehydratase family protein n=1 Tax=Mucilaginibacter antarcticus TaxID=1855725 RepID=A0ABW5XMG4_9SPHI
MKALISGASGFVGQNLLKTLANKVTFEILNRQGLNGINPSTEIDADVFIHLAGKAHDLLEVSNSDEYYQVNFELTKNLYDCFLRSNARQFIFVSSVKAAADHIDYTLTEEVIPNPQTHYGKSKLLAEQYIQNQSLPVGKSYYILRPCMIHGPGNKGNLNLLYNFVIKGVPYPLAAFENKRSFLSVKNFCFIISSIIDRDNLPGGVYQVADDEALSTNQVVSILASSLSKTPRFWYVPRKIVTILATVGDYLKLPITTERLKKLTENYVVSNQKIKWALDTQLPLNSIEGLQLTAKSFNQIT